MPRDFCSGLGITVDLNRLPLDDAKTYEMLASAATPAGCSRWKARACATMLRQMRPDRFEDLIAAVALYRPGPMASIPDYCRRKHGEASEAPHPSIHDILAETYGIIVYQEQVMQIAQTMAGYSLGGADLLRRAMGKKIPAEMEAQRDIFTKGAIARGIDPAKATEVFDLMAKFAGYGFNKCHAAPYGLLAYQTAWLKANHPEVFIAACMSLALGNTDRLAALREEAARSAIRILPPDINRSGADFTVERTADGRLAIRYALGRGEEGRLRRDAGAGRGARRSAVRRSGRSSPPVSIRVSSTACRLENLARAGAFDSLEAESCATVRCRGDDPAARAGDGGGKDSGQIALFGASSGSPGKRCACPTCPTGHRWSGWTSRRRPSAST